MTNIRYVVFQTPVSRWKYGMDFREYGVREHVQHYLALHKQGRFELGNPFLLQDRGGMRAATKKVSQEKLEAFAAAAPLCEQVCSSMKSARG